MRYRASRRATALLRPRHHIKCRHPERRPAGPQPKDPARLRPRHSRPTLSHRDTKPPVLPAPPHEQPTTIPIPAPHLLASAFSFSAAPYLLNPGPLTSPRPAWFPSRFSRIGPSFSPPSRRRCGEQGKGRSDLLHLVPFSALFESRRAVLDRRDSRIYRPFRAFGPLIHSSTHNDGYGYIYLFFLLWKEVPPRTSPRSSRLAIQPWTNHPQHAPLYAQQIALARNAPLALESIQPTHLPPVRSARPDA